jgi:hypothetical protein
MFHWVVCTALSVTGWITKLSEHADRQGTSQIITILIHCHLDLQLVVVVWFGGPCSLSFMPSDFLLFGPINKHLADNQFAREADIKQAFISWLHILDISFFSAIVKALVLQ